MTDLWVKPEPNYFRCTFASKEEKIFQNVSAPFVQFRQGFVPIGREMKKIFQLDRHIIEIENSSCAL